MIKRGRIPDKKNYLKEAYSKEQILKMKPKTIWPLIKDIKSKKEYEPKN